MIGCTPIRGVYCESKVNSSQVSMPYHNYLRL